MKFKNWLPSLISIVSVSPFIAYAQTVNSTGEIARRADWGSQIVNYAEKSFNNKIATDECTTKPDYYCNGLMVSAFENGSDTYWMHQGKSGVVSTEKRLALTYYRKDIATKLYGSAGFILFPQVRIDYAISHGLSTMPFSMDYKCIFPIDGNSNLRSGIGCGKNQEQNESAPCSEVGVTSGGEWIYKYIKDNNISSQFFCGFALNGSDSERKLAMEANVITQQYIISNKTSGVPDDLPWNEVVLPGWEEDAPKRVPVMALFYIDSDSSRTLVKHKTGVSDSSDALELAKKQQDSFYSETNIFIPIIKISLSENVINMTYSDEDQNTDIPQDVSVYPQ